MLGRPIQRAKRLEVHSQFCQQAKKQQCCEEQCHGDGLSSQHYPALRVLCQCHAQRQSGLQAWFTKNDAFIRRMISWSVTALMRVDPAGRLVAMPKENNLIAMGQDAHTPYARDTTCQDCRHMWLPASNRPIKRRKAGGSGTATGASAPGALRRRSESRHAIQNLGLRCVIELPRLVRSPVAGTGMSASDGTCKPKKSASSCS